MTETKTLLGYPDIKSLLAESDKRVREYAINNSDENTLHRLYEVFSLILAITETAAASRNIDQIEDPFTLRKDALRETEKIINLEIAFEDRLTTLERKYLQARNIRIRCVN